MTHRWSMPTTRPGDVRHHQPDEADRSAGRRRRPREQHHRGDADLPCGARGASSADAIVNPELQQVQARGAGAGVRPTRRKGSTCHRTSRTPPGDGSRPTRPVVVERVDVAQQDRPVSEKSSALTAVPASTRLTGSGPRGEGPDREHGEGGEARSGQGEPGVAGQPGDPQRVDAEHDGERGSGPRRRGGPSASGLRV